MPANVANVCASFKVQLLNGQHAFGTPPVRASATPDTFFGALYTAGTGITYATTAYSTTGEVTGTGYTAGGQAFTFANPPSLGANNSTAILTPSAGLTWNTFTSSAAFDCLLMYNQSQGNAAVCVFTFGSQTVTAGTFTLTMPVNVTATALLALN